MTFVAGFYSFNLALAHTELGLYPNLRLKLARHPEESDEYLITRLIAYAHSFEDDLQFTRGLFETKEPAIWKHSVIEELLVWIEIGLPPIEKIERALRHHANAKFKIYFHQPDQIDSFCYYLRGSKTNWVKNIEFYLVQSDFLDQLAPQLKSSNTWQLTFTDGTLFLSNGESTLETRIIPVNIWERFQQTLLSQA